MTSPSFPPLLSGRAVAGDPFATACEAARSADPGTVFHSPDETTTRAAILLAPETPLFQAVGVSFAVSLGLNDAIGALAPPEVGCHLVWPDRFRINGGLCGSLRAAAPTHDPGAEPDWLVLGIEIPIGAQSETPGLTPDETTLQDEGCTEITTSDLVEAWARHMMNWLHVYLTDGFAPLHTMWRSKGFGIGGAVDYPESGSFIGLDEWGGMILKTPTDTHILPLTRILEEI